MARYAGILWRVPPSVLIAGIDRGEQRFRYLLETNMQSAAAELQAYAQREHPWQNRTGDAEASFRVEAQNGGLRIEISHGVYYGIYLEYKHGGRWGIIPATIEYARGPVLAGMQDAVDNAWQ